MDKKIGPRSFVARLGKLGIASTAAAAMAAGLEGTSTPEALSGRQLPAGLTGSEIMAEMLLEWKPNWKPAGWPTPLSSNGGGRHWHITGSGGAATREKHRRCGTSLLSRLKGWPWNSTN